MAISGEGARAVPGRFETWSMFTCTACSDQENIPNKVFACISSFRNIPAFYTRTLFSLLRSLALFFGSSTSHSDDIACSLSHAQQWSTRTQGNGETCHMRSYNSHIPRCVCCKWLQMLKKCGSRNINCN